MLWYHGTDKESKESILDIGFISSSGRFGRGIYFTNNRAEAEYFGETVITVDIIDNDKVANIYYPDLVNLYPDLSIDEEEGVTDLERHITKGLKKKAVILTYVSGEKELCVYSNDIVEFI